MSVDLTKGATVELVKTLSDDLRTKDDNTKYSSAGAAMRDKANVDGYYEDLVSGGTEQLLSSIYEEDSEPYLFRTSGGSMDIGDREEDTIVGGTIAFNQLVEHGNFDASTGWAGGYTISDGVANATYVSDGSFNSTLSRNSAYIVSDHKYLVYARYKCTASNIIRARYPFVGSFKTTAVDTWEDFYWIGVPGNYGNIGVQNHSIAGATSSYKFIECFDLTQMFGSAIADYIYSLEQANAGAGVAFFKKLFPKPYYAYDAGTLKSVEGLSAHKMRGFNAWDEEWELGTYLGSTGKPTYSDSRIRSKNTSPIRVLPNTVYCFTSPSATARISQVCWYDSDDNFIVSQGNTEAVRLFPSPVNAYYMRFHMSTDYGTTYKNDICINLHWDGERDGEYEPYVKHSYPLDSSLVLRGIPKLDSNNKLYYDGDVYKADGTVERKYGIVDLGLLAWVKNTNAIGEPYYQTTSINASIKKVSDTNSVANVIMAKYIAASVNSGYNGLVKECVTVNANGYITIYTNGDYADATAFKAAMSGVYLVYELATPTTEEAEPYQTPQIVDDFGTEEYVTDSIVPVGHVTKYMPNLKAKLEMAPDSPSDNGDYIVRHTNGLNEYVPLVIPTELPTMPSEDGTYRLKVTVSNGTATLAWESES